MWVNPRLSRICQCWTLSSTASNFYSQPHDPCDPFKPVAIVFPKDRPPSTSFRSSNPSILHFYGPVLVFHRYKIRLFHTANAECIAIGISRGSFSQSFSPKMLVHLVRRDKYQKKNSNNVGNGDDLSGGIFQFDLWETQSRLRCISLNVGKIFYCLGFTLCFHSSWSVSLELEYRPVQLIPSSSQNAISSFVRFVSTDISIQRFYNKETFYVSDCFV